jgi:pheromone shutdown protein TraB
VSKYGGLLVLGDRDVQVTLQRSCAALSFWQSLKLYWEMSSTVKLFYFCYKKSLPPAH